MTCRVEVDVPYGNACDISVTEDDGVTVVGFASDPHGGPECLWFCFRLRRTAGGRGKVRLVWRHFGNALGGADPTKMRPVVRDGGGDWRRLGPGGATRVADGRLEAWWLIDVGDAGVDVALCYPYGREEVEALVAETAGSLQCDTIGVSQGGRPLWRVSNDYGQEGSDRPGVYVIARQHSGETPGSWVLDGFLRAMAEAGAAAPLVWAVPLSNIDGVEQGDYGKDNFPYDLNRAWGQPAMRHEVLVMQRDMARWCGRCAPVLAIDFHAPGACEADGAYFFLPKPDDSKTLDAQAKQWADRLADAMAAYASSDYARVAAYASRWETPTFVAHCCGVLGVCALSLETPYGMAGTQVLTREAYREIGARLARGIVAHVGRA